jgi:predicted acyl esterase
MNKVILVFLSVIICFVSLNSAVSQHKRIKHGTFPTTQTEFTLTMGDGTILDCTKFTASGSPPTGGWPALIVCHGYGECKEDMWSDAEDFASQGYFSVCYSMRGQGESGGLSNLISITEMNDFIAVVNYVKGLSGINANKVGAIGASQGGTIPLMAVCRFPGMLRCVISDVASPELGSDWIENNSVKMSLLWSLSYADSIVRYNNQVKAYRNWILEDTPAKWDSLKYYMPLNRDFSDKIAQNTTPLFISTVWQDKFFNTYTFLKNVYSFANPYRFYMGTFDAHGADNNTVEGNYHDDITTNWIDYYLGGSPNGAPDSARFTYASGSYPRITSGWTWKRFNTNTWPPAGVVDWKFYFHPNGVLNNKLHTSTPDTISFLNDIKDNTLTMTEAVNYEFTGSVFNTKFGKTQLIFETNALVADARMVGTPFVNIHYIPGANVAQFNLQVYEIKSGTTPYLVGRSNYTDRNVAPGVLKQLSFYGTAFSHIFQTGSKIRVIITNLDNIPNDPFLRTNPYVLPSLKRAYNRIYTNTANPTYIQLPLINYVDVGINPVSLEVPSEIKLFQNYPNPFNPVTNIKFSIPEKYSGCVAKLTVYDVNGREVSVLLNESLNSGIYEKRFEGNSLSSGIYFYSLTVKDFKETKRLLLVK